MTRMLSRHDLLPRAYQVKQKMKNPNLDNIEAQLVEKRAFDEENRKALEAEAALKTKKWNARLFVGNKVEWNTTSIELIRGS